MYVDKPGSGFQELSHTAKLRLTCLQCWFAAHRKGTKSEIISQTFDFIMYKEAANYKISYKEYAEKMAEQP